MNLYLTTLAALLAYVLFTWFLGNLMHLHGRDLWVLRIGLWIIGLAAAAVFIWFKRREEQAAGESSGEAAGPGHQEIDALIRDAEAKLAAARIDGGAKLSNLPAIFLIGAGGTAKTSTMIHSGLDPELIAGQVFQETTVVPTQSANLWFARRAIFVEAGGKLMADAAGWQRLVRRLRPGKLGAVVGKGQQAPRAALVCFDCEAFTRPGASEAVPAAARNLHAKLAEVSQILGIHLPLYVIFTRTDRLPFFNEYVRNLSNEEAAEVLGATLPMADGGSGVYAEQQAQRLSAAFNDLYYSLCDKRPDFLAREHDAAQLPGIYEFPREFRKLRASLVQFLVDLARPSQLTTGPFLRGFYFSGVRPIFIDEVTPAQPAPSQQQQGFESSREATGFFRMGQAVQQQAPPVAAPVRSPRKVPQWCFLGRLFTDVLLADRVAMGASGSSTQANTLRRVLLACGAGLCLIFAIGMLVSYFNNRALESQVLEAARGIASSESSGLNLASLDALRKLETLRQSFETLTRYEREGAPLGLRWGLYSGSSLYPEVRRIYFSRFHQLLFGQTQASLVGTLQRLPLVPSPSDEYGATYETLKAYLITTSNHDKSTRMFLGPVLANRWSAGRNVDAERLQLAQKQFDFYAEELKAANPFSSENDTLAVDRARRYLRQFGGIDRVYQFMLAEAAKSNPAVNFHQAFPNAAQAVIDRTVVTGAFTKGGWTFMQNAFRDPSRFFSGEQWVLGDQGSAGLDAAAVDQLRKRYQDDFVASWRAFLKNAAVLRYAGLKDASNKLRALSGPQSPLLELFSLVSQNTAVGTPAIDNNFKASHAVVPPGSVDQYIGPSNTQYMGGLVNLQVSIDQIAGQPGAPNDAAAAQTLQQAAAAKGNVGQMALTFGTDPEAGVVRQLLEAPITYVEPLLRGVGASELNAGGRSLCAKFRTLMAKYPFNPNATVQATLADVNGMFKPHEGAFWAFYDASLQKMLPKQGSQYVAAPSGTISLTPGFVGFFNRVAAFADALYAGGSADPHLNYTLKPLPSEGIQNLSLMFRIDGQTLAYTGGVAMAKQFVWPGASHEAVASVKLGGQDVTWSTNDGLWAMFQFFSKAEKQQGNTLEWVARLGRDPMLVNGKPLTVRLEVDITPPIYQRGYFSGLACVAEVAR
ncbi:MAG TPA: ImcF-related family protein [Bryobacteraceae bacterium]|nr:ImcF-related family protein [Bryobacteraceae bacterium]